ncbi:MAG: hypothetical protein HY900_13750 [Deltaproteobacteria bacterium]|nr:hypothetical protein [Deltaproteobacteria bacterium]
MLDKRSLHLKVQELCDCYAGTDYLKEMCLVPKEPDPTEAALKWIALAVLHGINSNADKIKISRSEAGAVTVTAEYRKATLPTPGDEIGRAVLEAVRQIVHFEKDKEKGPLALGVRNDSLELEVSTKRKDGGESATLAFPR